MTPLYYNQGVINYLKYYLCLLWAEKLTCSLNENVGYELVASQNRRFCLTSVFQYLNWTRNETHHHVVFTASLSPVPISG